MLRAALLVLCACSARPLSGAGAALWLGGDVHLGAGGREMLGSLPELTHGEPVVVNLEGPVGDGAEASSSRRLANGRGVPAALARAGVRIAGVENNHANDLGESGRRETLASLTAAGLAPAGVVHVVLGGQRVMVVAVDLTPGVPEDLPARLAHPADELLVATFHVTRPASYLAAPELEEAVEVALGAGARVIAAHGTHAVARVERRGSTIIAWGLGNLAFDCRCTDEGDGLLVRVELGHDGVTRATVVPVDSGLHGSPVRPAKNAPLALDLLESLASTPLRRSADRADF